MKIKLILIIAAIGLTNFLHSQNNLGTISGYTLEAKDSSQAIPLCKVWIESEFGVQYFKADLDGGYKIDALKPGTYNLWAKGIGFDTTVVSEVRVVGGNITTVDVYCTNDNLLKPVVILYNPLKIEKDIVHISLLVEDIEHSLFGNNPAALIANTTTDVKQMEGTTDLIIRGSRPGDVTYYIDGVKTDNMATIPGVAVHSLAAFTGGIPANYGDTTGGIVVLETKSYFDLYYAWKARQ